MAKRTRKKRDAGKETGGNVPTDGAVSSPQANAKKKRTRKKRKGPGRKTAGKAPTVDAAKATFSETPTVVGGSQAQGEAEAIPSLQGVSIIPLNSKETELIAKLGELDYATLRDMALERRWQAEVIQTGLEIKNWDEYTWYEQLKADLVWNEVSEKEEQGIITEALARRIEEARVLEAESDKRHPPVKEFVFPQEKRKPTPMERAETMIGSTVPEASAPSEKTPEVAAGPHEIETIIIPPEEDFSIYGDIFYAIEQVYLESGEKEEQGKQEDFGKRLERAIELAEGIASSTGEASPETKRAEKLRRFRKEFFEVEEGKELPQKDFDAYRLWLERKREAFGNAKDVFKAFGILSGEFSRKGILRVCNAALREGRLDSTQQKQVLALLQMLEEKESEEGADESAAERNAELAYELALAFGAREEKKLGKARIVEIERLENEIKKKKFESASHQDKQGQLVKILSRLHVINRREEETTGEVTRQLMEELEGIGSDYIERKKLMGAMFNMLAGQGQSGAELMKKADEAALAKLGVKRIDTGREETPEENVSKQHKHASKGIGIAISAFAGAAIFAAGMFASQYLGGGNKPEIEMGKPEIVQAEKSVRETVNTFSAEAVSTAAKKLSAKKNVGEVILSDNYSRNREGLRKALDDWCREERGLIVSGEMLRASYTAIEGKLDGSVLPMDAAWVPLMLEMKFPNKLIALAVMSDIARSEVEYGEKYAALMRLSIPLGERARITKSFPEIIKEVNAKGMALPKIDKDSYIGRIEAAKTGRMCLAAAYFGRVAEMMDEVKKDAIESGVSKKQFKKAVRGALGKNAKLVEKNYRRAKYWASTEKKRPACKLLSGGKNGFDALTRAYRLSKRWIKSTKREKKRQEELDEILGAAPPKVKTGTKHGKAVAASPCTGMNGMNYLSCVSKLNAKRRRAEKDTGKKKMHKPKSKESGTVSKSPKMLLR